MSKITKMEIAIIIEMKCKKYFGESFYLDVNKTFSELDIDSLDMYELAMECEEEFDVTIPDHEIAEFKTPVNLVDYIHNNVDEEFENAHGK